MIGARHSSTSGSRRVLWYDYGVCLESNHRLAKMARQAEKTPATILLKASTFITNVYLVVAKHSIQEPNRKIP
jgi:hypothetical protein